MLISLEEQLKGAASSDCPDCNGKGWFIESGGMSISLKKTCPCTYRDQVEKELQEISQCPGHKWKRLPPPAHGYGCTRCPAIKLTAWGM